MGCPRAEVDECVSFESDMSAGGAHCMYVVLVVGVGRYVGGGASVVLQYSYDVYIMNSIKVKCGNLINLY